MIKGFQWSHQPGGVGVGGQLSDMGFSAEVELKQTLIVEIQNVSSLLIL